MSRKYTRREVLEVSAREARGAPRDDVELDVVAERNPPSVHGEDALSAIEVGPRHDDAPVEAAGSQQRAI